GACLLSRIASARVHLETSLSLRQHIQNQRGAARVVESFAVLESEIDNHGAALQLLGAAWQYRFSSETLGISGWWKAHLDRAEERARAALATNPGEADRQ